MFGQVLRSVAVEKTRSGSDVGIHVRILPKAEFPTGGECLALIVIDEEPFICWGRKVRHSACNGRFPARSYWNRRHASEHDARSAANEPLPPIRGCEPSRSKAGM